MMWWWDNTWGWNITGKVERVYFLTASWLSWNQSCSNTSTHTVKKKKESSRFLFVTRGFVLFSPRGTNLLLSMALWFLALRVFFTDYTVKRQSCGTLCRRITSLKELYSYIQDELSMCNTITLDYRSTTLYSTRLIGDISINKVTQWTFSHPRWLCKHLLCD